MDGNYAARWVSFGWNSTGMLKRERVNHRQYRTRDEARADLFDYLERFHNPRMRRRVARRDREFAALIKPSVETG